TTDGNCIGGSSGGAPANAQYLVLSLDGNLSGERLLVDGDGLTLTDGGAGGNATLDVNVDGSTISINGLDELFVPTDGITSTEISDGTIQGIDVANDTIALGTKTTGDYVATLSSGGAGSGIAISGGT